MFRLNGKKINIDATIEINGQTFPLGFFRDPAARMEYGIEEVADPVRYDDRFYFITENEDGSLIQTPKGLDGLKEVAIQQIKEIRKQCHDAFAKSPGIVEVYNENLAAAQDVINGDGTRIMRSGVTSAQYCQSMATKFGMTSQAFCTYILSENQAAAQKAQQIEEEYLNVAYVVIPAADFTTIQTVVSSFVAYCESVIAA